MRKISKAKLARSNTAESDVEFVDSGPRRVAGSTITSWPGPAVIDLAELFAQPVPGGGLAHSPRNTPGPTIGGAVPGRAAERKDASQATVSLSDGTRISFVTADLTAIVDSG
jgi:hypothetical protein